MAGNRQFVDRRNRDLRSWMAALRIPTEEEEKRLRPTAVLKYMYRVRMGACHWLRRRQNVMNLREMCIEEIALHLLWPKEESCYKLGFPKRMARTIHQWMLREYVVFVTDSVKEQNVQNEVSGPS